VSRRGRDLNLLVGAVGLSALGDWLALVPLALHLEETTESGIVVALLFVAIWSPAIVLAGPAGMLADRVSPRKVLLVGSVVQAALAVVLAFASGTATVLVLAALLGSAFALTQPAEFALVPAIAGEARLVVANGRVETARYVGFTVGPLVGGVLAAAGGMQLALLVNAASFVVVAAVAAVVQPQRAPVPAGETDGVERARDGLVFLARDRVLSVVMVVAFVSLLFMTASAAAEVFFAKDVLEIGDVGYGILIGAWTLGMALGASLIAPRVATGLLAWGALVAIVIQGSGLALPTLWLAAGFAFVAYVVGGLAHGTKNVLVRTLMHERVPRRLHGRAFAAYNGLRNGAELVALLGGGLLVAVMGARWTLLLAGAIPVAATLLAVAFASRRLATEMPSQAVRTST
jgi:MFS family permease